MSDDPVYAVFPELLPPLPCPTGHTPETLLELLASFRMQDNSPANELLGYLNQDLRRFIRTLSLVPQGKEGRLIEIGANPYFTSILLCEFRQYKHTYTNYFGPRHPSTAQQTMKSEKLGRSHSFSYRNHNIEKQELPEGGFDVALFCEVLEHMAEDPLAALRNIAASLKPGGLLILTTPNVNRLENVAHMISGHNIYDPYSAYGIYGRHNREYNKHELNLMLTHLGFRAEVFITADVHANPAHHHCNLSELRPLLENRIHDLGQYIFLAARKQEDPLPGKLPWLYRSYPPNDMAQEKTEA